MLNYLFDLSSFSSLTLSFLCHLGESEGSKSSHTGVIVGAVVAVLVLLVLAILIGIYAIRQKRARSSESNPFGKK